MFYIQIFHFTLGSQDPQFLNVLIREHNQITQNF